MARDEGSAQLPGLHRGYRIRSVGLVEYVRILGLEAVWRNQAGVLFGVRGLVPTSVNSSFSPLLSPYKLITSISNSTEWCIREWHLAVFKQNAIL